MEKQRQSATDRQAQLITLLKMRGYCSITELSDILNVSPMTVRRDLSVLQEKHIVEAMYGGARFIASDSTEPDFATRSLEHLAAKQAIGRKAIEFLEEGDAIGLDSGSTIVEVARHLPNIPLTVVTHSLPAANLVVQNNYHQLIMLGGTFQPGSAYFYGPQAIATLHSLYINKLFLATGGLMLPGNLSSYYLSDAEIKQTLINVSRKIILCMDSSKIDRVFLARFASLDNVDTLITDDNISDKSREVIEQQQVQVVIASTKSLTAFPETTMRGVWK